MLSSKVPFKDRLDKRHVPIGRCKVGFVKYYCHGVETWEMILEVSSREVEISAKVSGF